MAMKLQGGDEAVSQALSRARQLYINKVQASAAADQLASLFAECAIAEAIPSQPQLSQHRMDNHSTEPDPQGTSILAETGGSRSCSMRSLMEAALCACSAGSRQQPSQRGTLCILVL
ncbi:UNVERIFIED_CONTAM: hypothetical protein Sradi_7235400 [Sesamum radiatum]|uniref:Uncharacterized protein n=1 Tax=Sesamum radiatum TaxID=300843 RepID=A0AAW2IM15_SESRA